MDAGRPQVKEFPYANETCKNVIAGTADGCRLTDGLFAALSRVDTRTAI